MGNSSPHTVMLIGQYTHELDSKKRFTVPAKWRKDLGTSIVITSGLDASLFVFSKDEWNKIAEKLSSLSLGTAESRNFNRFFLANAFELDIDSQGRIVIPDTLRAYASLGETLVLAGMYTRFEIWNEEKWNACIESSTASANAVAESLSSLGIF